MRLYVVGQDKKSGLYYVHTIGYSYIPVFGSFTESKSEAARMAANYSGYLTQGEWRKALERYGRGHKTE